MISNTKDLWKELWESDKIDFYHCQNPFFKEIEQILVLPIESKGYSGKYPTYNRAGYLNKYILHII